MLELLLEAGSPAVVMLACSIKSARLPNSWLEAIRHGHLVIVSATDVSPQVTEQRAAARNHMAARLATNIVIAHASPGGSLEAQAGIWRSCGFAVCCLG